jgi:hypothetical protein
MLRVALVGIVFLALGCEPANKPGQLPDPGPNGAEVTFNSEPAGATVIVDGVTIGSAPKTVKLKPGAHHVRARKSGYFPQEMRVSVTAQEKTSVGFTLVASH